jgi:hypothetical protein
MKLKPKGNSRLRSRQPSPDHPALQRNQCQHQFHRRHQQFKPCASPRVRSSPHAAKTSNATPKTKKKKSPGEDTNYQWPDDGVSRGIHPDYKGSPTATLLADDEEDFIFHVDHDMLIAFAIQDADSDPNSLAEAHSHSDWPLWKVAMDKETSHSCLTLLFAA